MNCLSLDCKQLVGTLVLIWVGLCAPFAIAQDGDTVTVRMTTSRGAILLELYPGKAPLTVNNFLRYVRAGAYDGGAFYRTVTRENDHGSPKIQVIQGGAQEHIERFEPVPHETTTSSGIMHEDGVISMARIEPGSAQTEFFICIGNQPSLNYGGKRNADRLGFAAFGRVISGMDTVQSIHEMPATTEIDNEYMVGQILTNPVLINRVEIVD